MTTTANTNDIATTIAKELGETQRVPIKQIQRIVQQLGPEAALGIQRRRDGVRRTAERGVERITHALDDVSCVIADGRTDQGVVAGEGGAHRLGLVLPARGAALDVREQEGNGPARQPGHAFP